MPAYDPKDIHILFGLIPLVGLADGTAVEIKHGGDGAKSYVGVGGSGAIVRDANRSAEVTVTLMATSLANALLTAHYQAGNPLVPCLVKSLSTGATYAAGSAVLQRMPDVSYGKEMPTVPWVIVIPEMGEVLAGSVA